MRYLALLLFIAGCQTSQGWTRGEDRNWQPDYAACENQAYRDTASFSGSGIELGIRRAQLINRCMAAQGWRT